MIYHLNLVWKLRQKFVEHFKQDSHTKSYPYDDPQRAPQVPHYWNKHCSDKESTFTCISLRILNTINGDWTMALSSSLSVGNQASSPVNDAETPTLTGIVIYCIYHKMMHVVLLCVVLLWVNQHLWRLVDMIYSPIFFRVAWLTLVQLYYRPNATEVTL